MQAAPPIISRRGYRRNKPYGCTNGRTFDLPHSILGGRIIEVLGQRGGKFSSRARHFPAFDIIEKPHFIGWFRALCFAIVYQLRERCGAKTCNGTPCQRLANKKNGRCRLHGGESFGPRTESGRAFSKVYLT
ncbi:HGGxSTG domain-containing protein [Alphaproteobacteria bacterium]|nr:HGGxSTG domain-containing protein [Alphaproteobacteria bacterium]